MRVDTPDAKRIALRVQDNGVGIPAPELKRIFRRFLPRPQPHPEQRRAGTGLGLFIVRAIVRKHGRPGVCRKPRGGPRYDRGARTSPERSMSRVLIVGDEAHLANRTAVQPRGRGSLGGGGGRWRNRAQTLLLGNRSPRTAEEFDAVVLDVMLPGKDGFAVASEVARGQAIRARFSADGARAARRCAQRLRLGSRRLSSQAFRAGHSAGALAGPAAAAGMDGRKSAGARRNRAPKAAPT